jgi:hypothetical protein
MRTLRCLFFFILAVAIGIMEASAQPLTADAANIELAGQQFIGSLDPAPTPGSMLLVGGGLLVFSGILRRRLRRIGPRERK